MATEQHVQINQKSGEGEVTKIYPINTASDVIITPADNLPENAETLEDVVTSLGNLAFEDSITIPQATESEYGVTKLSNITNDTTEQAETTAATTKALSEVQENAVHKNGEEEINGLKKFQDGIAISGINIKYSEDDKTLTIG